MQRKTVLAASARDVARNVNDWGTPVPGASMIALDIEAPALAAAQAASPTGPAIGVPGVAGPGFGLLLVLLAVFLLAGS